VPLPALILVLLDDPASVVARVPAGPGVGQVLGPEGRNLVLAPTPNLRKWLAARLGLGPAPAPGRRPPTNLAGVATAVGFARTRGPFERRLLFERLMAAHVPTSARRDLKPPAFVHLDPRARFPRLSVREGDAGAGDVFGPFVHRRAAEKARDVVNRRFGLRPCDFVFEPDPALPLGLGCLYAQVRSCAAPCLGRSSEADYRALGTRVAEWLGHPARRLDAPPAVPTPVSAVGMTRALVVDAGRREVGLFPVAAGRVLEEAAVTVAPEDVADSVRRLQWPSPKTPSDWPWLARFVASPKGRGSYLLVDPGDDRDALAAAARSALPTRLVARRGDEDGNVRPSQGEA